MDVKYHIVFTPKYRRKEIYNQVRKDLIEIFKRLCKYKGVEQEKLVEAVDGLGVIKETPSFMSKHKDFIKLAANHISVVSPSLPAITKFM